jgi:dTDP-D-glucose 4,6-dehydratase
LTGFSPSHDIRTGLQKTVDWFTQPEQLAKYKADVYNV